MFEKSHKRSQRCRQNGYLKRYKGILGGLCSVLTFFFLMHERFKKGLKNYLSTAKSCFFILFYFSVAHYCFNDLLMEQKAIYHKPDSLAHCDHNRCLSHFLFAKWWKCGLVKVTFQLNLITFQINQKNKAWLLLCSICHLAICALHVAGDEILQSYILYGIYPVLFWI